MFFKIQFEKEKYINIFKKENLVYLTSESPNILQTLDYNKFYIIGSLVDHNSLKSISYNKANEQGIQTAQLPIGDYIKMASRKVLTVNQGLKKKRFRLK